MNMNLKMLAFVLIMSSVGFSWLNTSYSERIPVNLTASDTFQTMFTLNSSNLNMSKVLASCADINMAWANDTQIPFWIETCNTSANINVWVNKSVNNTMQAYVYYKNNTAVTTTSNGNNVFLFYDDAISANINTTNFPSCSGYWSIDSDALAHDGKAFKYTGNYERCQSSFSPNDNQTMMTSIRSPNGDVYGAGLDMNSAGKEATIQFDTGRYNIYNGNSYNSVGNFSFPNIGYTKFELYVNTTDNMFYACGNKEGIVFCVNATNNRAFNKLSFYAHNGVVAPVPIKYWDYIAVRKTPTAALTTAFGAAEIGAAAPVIGFSAQSPVNITSTTLYSQRIFLNFSVNNSLSGINTSLVKMWYNMSKPPIVNGTLDVMPQSFTPRSNISDLFLFDMGETKNYPGTYNVNQIVMQNTTHISRQLNTSDSWYSIKLENITNNQTANVFEVMFNSTGSTQATDVWACNSSYTTGSISSPNCVILKTVPSSNAFNHSHPNADYSANLSKHHVIPLNINTTTGKIGAVYVTPVMTFLVKSPKNNPNLLVYGITGTARAGAFAISTNGGTSWTADDTMIADAHVHQFDSITSNEYWVEACDLSNPALCANSTMRYINSTAVPTGPSSPVVTSPTSTSYQIGDTILTSWEAAIPGEGSVISNYSVHLLNADDSVNQTIGVGIPQLNITGYAAVIGTDFRMRVTAFADNGLESIGLSPEFNITAIVPPSGNGTTVIVNVSVVNNFNITVNNTVIVNNTVYVNNTNNINITVNNTVNTNNTINVNVSVNNTVIVNVNSSTGTTTNATNNPASGGYVFTSSTAQAAAAAAAGGNPLANLPIGQAFNPGSNIVTGQLFSFSGLTGAGFANIMTLLIVGIAAAIGISILKGAKE